MATHAPASAEGHAPEAEPQKEKHPPASHAPEQNIKKEIHHAHAQYERALHFPPPKPIAEAWKPLPSPPSLSTLGKAGLTGVIIAAPPAGIALAAGVGAVNL